MAAINLYSLLLLQLVIVFSSCCTPLTDKAFSGFMERYLSDEKKLEAFISRLEAQNDREQYKEIAEQKKGEAAILKKVLTSSGRLDRGNSPARGNLEANVQIVIFSDFECPYCRDASKVFDRLLREYPGKFSIIYKHFPLSFHSYSKYAALASEAAERRNRFWRMHDQLFASQDNFSTKEIDSCAKRAGLNITQFTKDMKFNTDALIDSIRTDLKLAHSLGVSGTSSIFINGIDSGGIRSFDFYSEVISKMK